MDMHIRPHSGIHTFFNHIIITSAYKLNSSPPKKHKTDRNTESSTVLFLPSTKNTVTKIPVKTSYTTVFYALNSKDRTKEEK